MAHHHAPHTRTHLRDPDTHDTRTHTQCCHWFPMDAFTAHPMAHHHAPRTHTQYCHWFPMDAFTAHPMAHHHAPHTLTHLRDPDTHDTRTHTQYCHWLAMDTFS